MNLDSIPPAGEVRGISEEGVIGLLGRFREAEQILNCDLSSAEHCARSTMRYLPGHGAAVIAAYIRPGDLQVEECIALLPLDAQLAILVPILRLTLPTYRKVMADRRAALGIETDWSLLRRPRARRPRARRPAG